VVALIGRLGTDPEVRCTASGVPVANFRIAVNEYRRDQNGERKERTHWFSCVAWRSLAETVEKYLSKGSQVGISGSLRQRTWQNEMGETRSTVEIVVRNLTMLDNKRREEVPIVEDNDIPF